MMKCIYESPQIDIIEVEVEQGFAASQTGGVGLESLDEEEGI